MTDDYVWAGWEPEPDEDTERYYQYGVYLDYAVHENNNRGMSIPGPNDDTSRPIWGQDILGNKVLVGYEQYEDGDGSYEYYAPAQGQASFGMLPFLILLVVIVFAAMFLAAGALGDFGQSSGIAPAVNGWLGVPGGLP